MNVPAPASAVSTKSHHREQALQITVAGMAYSTAFLIELLGRDQLQMWSYWALVLFSLAVPLWMLTWTIYSQLDLIKNSKSETWRGKLLCCMPVAFILSMLATGFELARVMGALFIGFEAVAVWVLWQMFRIMDDHESETPLQACDEPKSP